MIYSIQFLRFFAALCVVMHHSISNYGGNFMSFAAGVDVFFVISGFVISHATSASESVRSFLTKRFIRVVPMWWLALAFFAWFETHFWNQPPGLELSLRSAFLIPVPGGRWFPFYTPGWSLFYECAFYGLFAMCMLAFKNNFRFACAMGLLMLACTNLAVPAMLNRAPISHYFETRILLEFVFGLMIAHSLPAVLSLGPVRGAALIIISLAEFAFNYGSFNPDRALAWGVPSAMLVVGVMTFEFAPFFRMKFIRRLGAASYSIYLTHMTLMNLAVNILPGGATLHNYPALYVTTMLMLATTFGVTVNVLIEEPLLRLMRRFLLASRDRHGSEATSMLPTVAPVVTFQDR